MTGGAIQTTGNPLDVAIQGDGFFQIGEGAPTGANSPITPTAYTRAGNFSINTAGYLTTQTGQYVDRLRADAAGDPITTDVAIKIPAGATGVAIDQNGGVSYVDPGTQTRVTAYRLTLATFSNSSGLEREGGNQLGHLGQLGPEDRQHPGPRRPGRHEGGRGRDVQRRPRADVHEHDHRPARLPGQLARHLDGRRDAAGSGEPEALTHGSERRGVTAVTPPRKARLRRAFLLKALVHLPMLGV